jgi:4-oxalmesaconate hydratase
MKPVIENIGWLTEAQKVDIFECNYRRVDSKAFSTAEQC